MGKDKKEETTLADVLIQLKITNRLLAAQLRQSMPQNELVSLLASVGGSNREIADAVGTSSDVVRITLNRQKEKAETQSARSGSAKDGKV